MWWERARDALYPLLTLALGAIIILSQSNPAGVALPAGAEDGSTTAGAGADKKGICGADPAPAGNVVQNLSPQIITLINTLTAEGEPPPAEEQTPLECTFGLTIADGMTPDTEGCTVAAGGRAPCALTLDMRIDIPGGAPPNTPTTPLLPVGVYFIPPAFEWTGDTAVANGTEVGDGAFAIRSDAGLGPNGVPCQVDVIFPPTPGTEGGVTPNVPDSDASADITNPEVWPNDLNAERALVEESLSPIPGIPVVELWSRMIVQFSVADQRLPMNVLTWKVTNPVMQLAMGAEWVVVAFPGDALNPDPAGPSGGDPDADDPEAVPVATCAPHEIVLSWSGLAADQPYISCDQAGSQMAWALIDPDAMNTTGDEGPRSDVADCAAGTPAAPACADTPQLPLLGLLKPDGGCSP